MPPPLPICPRALLSSTSTRALLRQPSSKPQSHTALSPPSATRPFSSSTALKSGDGHESHYDPPSGWLWGIPPGEKPKKEGWETIWYWGFWGSLLVLGVGGWVYREDSSWASLFSSPYLRFMSWDDRVLKWYNLLTPENGNAGYRRGPSKKPGDG